VIYGRVIVEYGKVNGSEKEELSLIPQVSLLPRVA
jgi:hypothetical protein